MARYPIPAKAALPRSPDLNFLSGQAREDVRPISSRVGPERGVSSELGAQAAWIDISA